MSEMGQTETSTPIQQTVALPSGPEVFCARVNVGLGVISGRKPGCGQASKSALAWQWDLSYKVRHERFACHGARATRPGRKRVRKSATANERHCHSSVRAFLNQRSDQPQQLLLLWALASPY
jgi:hypothetical protein